MLSIVVVGRNDNHGYNLGKRVASSLNSIAMRLSDGDEIIFVDWNTPRPFPPMPVSILDDLTDEAKKFLKILVVDPEIHDSVKGKSSKMILEPIARNVGIRRTKVDNRWILSTNTDIIFVGNENLKLKDTLSILDERLWQSYRYEIPEYMWERFDKRDPKKTNLEIMEIEKVLPIQLKLSTNPVAESLDYSYKFADAIGDFQLAPREMWNEIRGFPEDMLDGWHVDSRAAVQMIRVSGTKSKIIDDSTSLKIYHQNHLRSLTHFHTNSKMNGIELIAMPYRNDSNWGLSAYPIEEYKIFDEPIYVDLPQQTQRNFIPSLHLQDLTRDVHYDLGRTAVFLFDEILALKKNERLVVLTANSELVSFLNDIRIKSEFEVIDYFKLLETKELGEIEALNSASLVVIDCGIVIGSLSHLKKIKALDINLRVSTFADQIKPGTRVAIIRAQNWAIRKMVSLYFSLPLFNNYSSVLSGSRRQKDLKINSLKRQVLQACIKFEFNVDLNRPQIFVIMYLKLKRLIPLKLKTLVAKRILN